MKIPAPADLQRWSDEVARDPSSLAFLPLARAYRRQGQRAAARQLCLRGLEHYPTHTEAHSLLALLYLEDGERARAADEWSMVLRMEPNHFEALRGIGFCYLEQDQLSRARQALERAALLRPHDAAVQEALKVLGTRQELHSGAHTNAAPDDVSEDVFSAQTGEPQAATVTAQPSAQRPMTFEPVATPAPAAPPPAFDEPWAAQTVPPPAQPQSAPPAAPQSAQQPQAQPQPIQPAVQPQPLPMTGGAERAAISSDPSLVFESLMTGGPLLGALLLDAQGLVMAGRLGSHATGDALTLGATIGPAINEAGRTVAHLGIGEWRGMLLEAATAVLHVSPAAQDTVVLLAAKRNAPTGWVLRTAGQAADLARRYLEEYA